MVMSLGGSRTSQIQSGAVSEALFHVSRSWKRALRTSATVMLGTADVASMTMLRDTFEGTVLLIIKLFETVVRYEQRNNCSLQ
jgi:hypothetical protein